jgi:hypothetical protein
VPILGGRAEVVFPAERLTFTAAELAAGVELGYRIVVKDELVGVVAETLTSAASPPEGPCDLLPLASVVGDGQSYCVQDYGLGAPSDPTPRTIPAGEQAYTLSWTGRNWSGPSCTSEPLGAAFPPGTYAFTVRLRGHLDEPYRVECSVPLVIAP